MCRSCHRRVLAGVLLVTFAIASGYAQQADQGAGTPAAAGETANNQVLDPQNKPPTGVSVKLKSLEPGDPAPPLSIAQWLSGEAIDKFEPGQVYVVEFWATWCGPCRVSMPHISALQEQYGDKVRFIGVTREPESTVQGFLNTEQSEGKTWQQVIKYRLAIDSSGATNAAYMQAAGQSGIPCAFVVGQDGVVEWIGHPAVIADPLAKVVAGEWDRQAVIAQFRLAKRLRQVSSEIAALRRNQEWDKALAVLEQLEAEFGSSADCVKMRLGILLQAGRTEETAQWQAKLVELSWDNAQQLNEFAWNTAIGQGTRNLDLALKAAERATLLTHHTDAPILDTLARVHYEQGRLDEALKWQREAAQHNSGLSAIVETLLKYETEKVLRMDPSDPRRQAELERIDRLKPTALAIREAGGRCGFARGSEQIVVSVTFENTLDIDQKLAELKQRLEGLPSLESLTFTRMHRISSFDQAKKELPPLPPNAGVTDAGLTHISGLTGLKTLQLRGVNVSDEGLKPIAQLTGLQTLSIMGTQVTDEGLAHLSGLTSLRSLQLWTDRIHGSGLQHLKRIPTLAILDLGRTPIADVGLEPIRELPNLLTLNLTNTKITDAGLEHLKDRHSLQSLDLTGTQITDSGLEHLKELSNLRTLSLSGTRVSGAGLKHLAEMKQLSNLNLRNTAVNDDALEQVAGLRELQMLSLDATQVTDEGLTHLAGLSRLVWLTLSGTQVTDAGLEHLTRLTNLRMLGWANTKVTPEGYAKLKKQLPNLR